MTLRNAFGDLNLETTQQSILARQIELRTRLDALIAGPVKTRASAQDLIDAGLFYISGSGQISLTVGSNVRSTVRNPTGSGRLVHIVALETFATATAYGTVYLNPTTNLPDATAERPKLSARPAIAPAPVVQVRANTGAALSGGTATGLIVPAAAGPARRIDLPPITLDPGQSLGVNIPFSGAAETVFTVFVLEQPQ